MQLFLILFAVALTGLTGCDVMTDPATRLAYDIKAGVKRLGKEEGATLVIRHATPSKPGECAGPFKVQLDKVGLLVVWCQDDSGEVVSSSSTSYHRRFVDTAETLIVDKPAGSVLLIHIEKRNRRAVITQVS